MKKQCFAVFTCFVLLSCSSKTKVDSGFSKAKPGFDYKIISAAVPGDSIRYRDVVKIQLHQYLDDSLMSTTIGRMPQYVEVNSELREYDYTYLLSMMKVNDSAVCLFDTKDIISRAAGASIPDFLKKGRQVKVFFRILNKFSAEADAMYDQEKTQRDLVSYTGGDEKTGFSNAAKAFDSLLKAQPEAPVKLESGVYVRVIEKGSGGKITTGQEVTIIYSGMTGNGKVFEERGKDNPLVIHAAKGETVKGFDAGIASLSVGDKAVIYVPAPLGYGAQRAGEYIPGFSNLVFEVEIAVQDNKTK
jgi:FKBP-type peptidyl-prolyl cis-trans isomerase FkpA